MIAELWPWVAVSLGFLLTIAWMAFWLTWVFGGLA